jgi:hypothetical protein
MTNSFNVTPKARKVLEEVLEELDKSDEPTESHLPHEVTKLDKAALLAVIYRLVAKVRD